MRYRINGNKVRDLRGTLNISQKKMAEKLKIPYMTMRRIEEVDDDNFSRIKVDKKIIQEIAKILNTPYRTLIPIGIDVVSHPNDFQEIQTLNDNLNEYKINLNFYKVLRAQEILKICSSQEELSVVDITEDINPERQREFIKFVKIIEEEILSNNINKQLQEVEKIFNLSNSIQSLDNAGYHIGYSLIGRCTAFDVDEFGNTYWQPHGDMGVSFGIKKLLLLTILRKEEKEITIDSPTKPSALDNTIVKNLEISVMQTGLTRDLVEELINKIFIDYEEFIKKEKK